jgi:symplekin
LDNTPANKLIVKGVFLNVIITPAQALAAVSSNLPNRSSSDLITPVELMTLLHLREKEIGLKCTIEGEGWPNSVDR